MKTWDYIALFLDGPSKARLRRLYNKAPKDWTWHGDHVTLAFNDGENEDEKIKEISLKITYYAYRSVHITAVAQTDKVYAVRVKFRSNKKNYHITLATAPGVTPVEANDIPESAWKAESVIPLDGRLGYSLDNKVIYKIPLSGKDVVAWVAMQAFDFLKKDIMRYLKENGCAVSEETYFKAERAAKNAFVKTIISRS